MRLKRCIVASVLVVSFCLPSPAQQSVGGSIAEEVVKTALERNQEFLAARERVAEAEALLRQAGIRPVPTIEVESSTGRILGSRASRSFPPRTSTLSKLPENVQSGSPWLKKASLLRRPRFARENGS